MKEGHNLSYVTKMGAYGLAVAAAFAVALAVLLSVSTTATVDAADPAETTNGGKVEFGSTNTTAVVEFKITDSSTASGSFTHKSASSDGQSILCQADDPCDSDDQDNGVQVELKVDDDSPAGFIIVSVTPIGGTATSDFVKVTRAQVPTRLTVKPASKSIAAGVTGADGVDPGSTTIQFTVEDEKGNGIAGKNVSIITTNGELSGITGCTGEAACVAATVEDDDNVADGDQTRGTVTLTGNDRAGVATVTFISGDLTTTLEVTMFGAVHSISAASEQGSIEIGGSTFIVVTVLDRADNAVGDAQVNVDIEAEDGSGGIEGPAARTNKVTGHNDRDKDANGNQKADKGDYPACGNQAATDYATGGDAGDGATNLLADGEDVGAGTNGDGKCVIEVRAPNPAGTASDATRGPHTLTIKAEALSKDSDKVAVEIQVGGAPASISSDADGLGSVEPLSSTKVTYTVLDDESVRVGGVKATVDQIAGDGKITAGDGESTTKDGQGSFTFRAPLGGDVVLLITVPVGSNEVTHTIELAIGAPVEDPPDPPPSLDRAPSATGVSLVTFTGGSVEELGAVLAAACGAGASAYATDYQGEWVTYIPDVGAPVVNAPFLALFADGIPANTPLLIGNCGG